MQKFLGVLLLSLLVCSNAFAAKLPSSWGIANMQCSQILKMKNEQGESFDRWLFMSAQGLLSGLNFWHYEKYKVSKKIAYNDRDYVIALVYNECKRDKNNIVGWILMEYLISLPDDN